jgi:hypothetical protein
MAMVIVKRLSTICSGAQLLHFATNLSSQEPENIWEELIRNKWTANSFFLCKAMVLWTSKGPNTDMSL